ncbi:unnamed protein product [Periconia digitata]|uniref:Uncharacterized protein n=1 Tax=Periconia digitata TaxID=1303443 RepID=A0A9W4XRI8_9PLEO|nr:unnamed protein product [Periconia digitata]
MLISSTYAFASPPLICSTATYSRLQPPSRDTIDISSSSSSSSSSSPPPI